MWLYERHRAQHDVFLMVFVFFVFFLVHFFRSVFWTSYQIEAHSVAFCVMDFRIHLEMVACISKTNQIRINFTPMYLRAIFSCCCSPTMWWNFLTQNWIGTLSPNCTLSKRSSDRSMPANGLTTRTPYNQYWFEFFFSLFLYSKLLFAVWLTNSVEYFKCH